MSQPRFSVDDAAFGRAMVFALSWRMILEVRHGKPEVKVAAARVHRWVDKWAWRRAVEHVDHRIATRRVAPALDGRLFELSLAQLSSSPRRRW